jgi:hypothetical protein
MARRRKIRDEADALACLERLEQSGLPLATWAQRSGIDGRSLHCWRMKLDKRRKKHRAPLALVELVTQPEPSPPESTPSGSRYLVRIGDFEIEVQDDFEPTTLARLLEVVVSC